MDMSFSRAEARRLASRTACITLRAMSLDTSKGFFLWLCPSGLTDDPRTKACGVLGCVKPLYVSRLITGQPARFAIRGSIHR